VSGSSESRSLGKIALAILSFCLVSFCLVSRPCLAANSDPWLGQDKALHFSACFMFAGDGYAGASVFTKRETTRLGAGAGIAVAAGAAKEVYDRYSGGDASLRDLTWDVVGAATGTMLSWLVDRYLF
jgi:putative lipoprotein